METNQIANCFADANLFKDAFLKAQKENEALFGKSEKTEEDDKVEEKKEDAKEEAKEEKKDE